MRKGEKQNIKTFYKNWGKYNIFLGFSYKNNAVARLNAELGPDYTG